MKKKPLMPSEDPNWRAPTTEEVKKAFEEGKRLADDLYKRMKKMEILHPCHAPPRRR